MSYEDFEISTKDGRPVSLYRLDWGNTTWLYTNADRAIERQELVKGAMATVRYEPRPVKDSGLTQGTSSQNDFTLDGPSDMPIVRLFRGSPPAESIWLTVRRLHGNDANADAPIYWKGIVTNVKRPGQARATVIGRPLSAFLKRSGLRLCWTRECPHFLYDAGCKVDKAQYAEAGTVTAHTAVSITVQLDGDFVDDYFRGGYAAWPANDDGTMERRMIEVATGSGAGVVVLTIMGLVDFLTNGQAITLYPGCDRTPTTCETKFNNTDNYGGFKDMPGASPFVTPIW